LQTSLSKQHIKVKEHKSHSFFLVQDNPVFIQRCTAVDCDLFTGPVISETLSTQMACDVGVRSSNTTTGTNHVLSPTWEMNAIDRAHVLDLLHSCRIIS